MFNDSDFIIIIIIFHFTLQTLALEKLFYWFVKLSLLLILLS